MAITISGENNNDRITAQDGVIDTISGFNIAGIITASSFTGDLTGNVTGNLTGNVNSTSPLLLQTGGSERFRITGNNELGIAGANYGSSGQVLTSGGSGSAVSWATPAVTSFTAGSDNRVVTATSGAGIKGEANLNFDGTGLGLVGHIDIRTGSSINTNVTGGGASGTLHKNTTSGEFAIVSGGTGGNNYLTFYTSANAAPTEKLRITHNGYVGISTGSPGRMVHIFSRNTGHPLILERGDGSNTQIEIKAAGVTRGYWGSSSTANFLVYDNDTSDIHFVVNQTGKVGINETSPLGTLHIKEGDSGLSAANANADTVFIENSANAGITIATPNTNTGYLTFADPEDDNVGQIIYRHGGSYANSMGFFTNAGERVRIMNNGNVNIGTSELDQTVTGRLLNVYGGQIRARQTSSGNTLEAFGHTTSGQSYGLLVNAGTTANDYAATFRNSGGTTMFRVRGDGSVRVGDNSSFSAHTNANNLVVGTTSGSNGMTLLTGSGTGTIFFNDGSGNDGVVQYVHSSSPNYFRIASSGHIRFDAAAISISDDNIAPTAGDMASGASFGIPRLHMRGDNSQSGAYELMARFQSGTDANDSGATIVLNHSNDRGLALQGGRGQSNRSFGAIKAIDNLGRLSNCIDFLGGNGQGVNYLRFFTGESTTTTERLKIDASGNVLINGSTFYSSSYNGSLQVHDASLILSKTGTGTRNWRFVNNNVAVGNLGLQVSQSDNGSTSYGNVIEITKTGRVGINEGSPDYMLHLSGSVPAICFEDTDGTHGQAIIEQNNDNLKIRCDAGNASSGTGSNIRFEVDGVERMRIENLGDSEYGMRFFNSKAIEFKSQQQGIFTLSWSINANTWTNFFSIPDYFQGWLFLNGTHNAGNSSALWSISKSYSGGAHANRFAHDNLYSPASVTFRINGVWVQINSSYATYGYATLITHGGGNGVANLSG